jgi:hypothetical protein
MRRRITLKWLLLLLLGSLSVGAGWLYWPRSRDLLSHSSSVMSLEWNNQPGMPVIAGWLSDHEVLFCYMIGIGVFSSYSVLDTRSNTARPLTALNDALRKKYPLQHSSRSGFMVSPFKLSPNGQWLLGYSLGKEWMITRLDGSGFQRWTEPHEDIASWRTDSQGLLCLDTKPDNILFHPLSDLNSTQRFALPSSLGDFSIQGAVQGGLLASAGQQEDSKPVRLAAISLGHEGKPVSVQHYSVPLPEKGILISLETSHQGDQVGWLMRYERQAARLPFLTTIFPQFKDAGGTFASLWISRLDGTGMCEVGRMKEELGTDKIIGDWGWLPGGKHLWYEYEDRLWRVPVPN